MKQTAAVVFNLDYQGAMFERDLKFQMLCQDNMFCFWEACPERLWKKQTYIKFIIW